MSFSGERVLNLPCLGRPFRLGMLYDCRTDCIIPGVTLWDSKDLKLTEESMQSYQPSSSFELIAEDSLADKTFHLGVEASLALSFMSGMVSVSGSAKYLNDKKDSKKTSRVTLQFTCTSHFKELSMEHLGNLKYKNVLERDIATHVVTGVVYGADAFFVFDREIAEKEDYQEVHGEMQIAIKAIPNIQIDGKGSLDVKNKEVEETDKFHCKFYGDILLPENPTTFKGAVKVYQDLPGLIGITKSSRPINKEDSEDDPPLEGNEAMPDAHTIDVEEAQDDAHLMKHLKTVPKTVWLYPLAKLTSKGDSIVRDISTRLVGDSAKLLESLHDIQMRTNDLMKSKAFYNFQGIKHQLMQFKDLIAHYETYIMQQLSVLLPEIRGGGMEEQKLANLFQTNHDSPFSYFHLVSYLDRKEREIKVLEKCLEFMGKAEKPENKKVVPINDQATEKTEKSTKEDSKAKSTDSSESPPPKLDHEATETAEKSSIKFAFQTGEMDSVIYSFDHEHVLSFEFANIEREDDFLVYMQNYLKTAKDAIPKRKKIAKTKQAALPEGNEETGDVEELANQMEFQQASDDTPKKGWYEDPNLIADMRNKVVQFKHFVRANMESEKTCFALTDGSLKNEGIKKGAMIHLYEGGMPKEFTPPSRPGKPSGNSLSSTSISLKWEKPSYGENTVNYYIVFYCSISPQVDVPPNEDWTTIKAGEKNSCDIKNLEKKTQYIFQVQAVCAIGNSEKSEVSEVIETKSTDHLEEMIMKSTLISAGTPETYLYSSEKCILDEKFKIAKYEIGDFRISRPMKTILVTGLSPSSRQSMINTLFNHVFGVTWGETTRFQLGLGKSKEIDQENEAEWLKIFDIAPPEDINIIPFTLRIVEIPVAGLKYETNYQQLITAFTNFEIDSINCIVLTRINSKPFPNHSTDIACILTIFGKNLRNLLYEGTGDPNDYDGFLDLPCNIKFTESEMIKIPYYSFMNPCSADQKKEIALSEAFKQKVEQFFELVGSDSCSKVSTSETLKVLNNMLVIHNAAIEIYKESTSTEGAAAARNKLRDRVKKSMDVIESYSITEGITLSPGIIEDYMDCMKPQQSEYLQMKKILAELIEEVKNS